MFRRKRNVIDGKRFVLTSVGRITLAASAALKIRFGPELSIADYVELRRNSYRKIISLAEKIQFANVAKNFGGNISVDARSNTVLTVGLQKAQFVLLAVNAHGGRDYISFANIAGLDLKGGFYVFGNLS
jgi:hypothetical protein